MYKIFLNMKQLVIIIHDWTISIIFMYGVKVTEIF